MAKVKLINGKYSTANSFGVKFRYKYLPYIYAVASVVSLALSTIAILKVYHVIR